MPIDSGPRRPAAPILCAAIHAAGAGPGLRTRSARLLFLAALAVQISILALVPREQAMARLRGHPITLATLPVDPYNILSGYSVTLSYEIERGDPKLFEPGLEQGERAYFTVERAEPAWRLISVTSLRPDPKPNQATLKGTYRPWASTIDSAGRLYIPEEQREAVARALRDRHDQALVDLMVDDQGNVAVLRLRAGTATFGE